MSGLLTLLTVLAFGAYVFALVRLLDMLVHHLS